MLFTIEGIDGSGKNTLSMELKKFLKERTKKNVSLISFPDYDSDSGKKIKEYLTAKASLKESLRDIKNSIILFAKNRKNFKFSDSEYIIADRYVESNIYYNLAKVNKVSDKSFITNFVLQLEYRIFKMKKPDFIFYLTAGMDTIESRLKNRKGKTGGVTGDLYENNLKFLERVNQEGINYFSKLSNAEIIRNKEEAFEVLDRFLNSERKGRGV